MSTDVTRGPKLCPACGKENLPTAARCSFCLAPLDAAIQTAPAAREMHDPDFLRSQSLAPSNGCLSFLGLVSVVFFTIIAAGVTFFLTCLGTAYVAEPALGFAGAPGSVEFAILISGVAAVAVAAIIVVTYRRWRQP